MTPAAAERNRVASLARYYANRSPDTGPWGGARKCKPGCTCKRHGRLARIVEPTVEREGRVVRIYCAPCNRRLAGVFDDDEVAALVEVHRHRRRTTREERQTEMSK